MAAPHPPYLSEALQDLCSGNFTDITTHLTTLTNTCNLGTALATIRPVLFVTAFRTANLRVEQMNAALPEDVSYISPLPSLLYFNFVH